MSDDKQKTEVNIMGRRYSVVCPPQQEEELREAVSFLNGKVQELKYRMENIKTPNTTWNRDSLMAIIALNLSHELLQMNVTVSGKAMEAERLVARIKNSFTQLDIDSDDALQKISEVSL